MRVNAMLPVQVLSKGFQEPMLADPILGANFLRGIPMGRLDVSDEIRSVALFLASDASAWITAALIPKNGGNSAKNTVSSHPGMSEVCLPR